jgi:hypothetical protein
VARRRRSTGGSGGGAMMVVEAAVSGGDRSGRWWGVTRGVVLLPFREPKGRCQKVAHEHTHEASSAVWPEEEDDRARPTCW